jgi:uncharacterized protein (TIRG00374 family)
VLALSFAALRLRVPWQGLLFAYVTSQVAATLPLLGCIGLVEVTMTVALVCTGVKADSALAAVLLYRLVSFWSTLPVGWLAWVSLRRRDQPTEPRSSARDRQPPAATSEPWVALP